jgi:hypothetical protein
VGDCNGPSLSWASELDGAVLGQVDRNLHRAHPPPGLG